jgi:small subunit ribosomal protein S18
MKQSTSRRPAKGKDTTKKVKKKTSILISERIDYVDYKDVNLLQRFMSDRSKIRARRVSGNDTQQQRDVAQAIKNAREMALLPYAKRVTTQRSGRPDRGERGERGERGDRGDRGERAPEVDVDVDVDVEDIVDETEAAEAGEE